MTVSESMDKKMYSRSFYIPTHSRYSLNEFGPHAILKPTTTQESHSITNHVYLLCLQQEEVRFIFERFTKAWVQ